MTRFILDTRITEGTMPMAVYTFLESYDFTGRKFIHSVRMKEADCQIRRVILKKCKGAVIEKGIAIYGSSVDQAKDVLEDGYRNRG